MFGLFEKKGLADHLNKVSTVKISGVLFTIKRFTPLNHLDGSNILLNSFDTYSIGPKSISTDSSVDKMKQDLKKMRDHFRDVFMASIVKPKLSRKQDVDGDEGIFVDEIFDDWDMACGLYEKIMTFTYGKKKTRLLGFRRKDSQN